MLKYIFGAGAVLGTWIGFKLGHAVGSKTPQRKLLDARVAIKKAGERVVERFSRTKKNHGS